MCVCLCALVLVCVYKCVWACVRGQFKSNSRLNAGGGGGRGTAINLVWRWVGYGVALDTSVVRITEEIHPNNSHN
jgi:hypothetical protein